MLRDLPVTSVGDGSNVNNGSAGASTLNLRGLGPERNLILINGKRVTPFNYDGEVDTSVIPTALIDIRSPPGFTPDTRPGPDSKSRDIVTGASPGAARPAGGRRGP